MVAEFLEAGESVGGDFAGGDGGLDGAAWFGVVFAVAEGAVVGEFLDVVEGVGEAVGGFPEVEFAHAGGVDDDAAGG